MPRRAIALVLALAGGCIVSPVDYSDTQFSCAADGICPEGFECVAGVCLTPDAGVDAGGSGFARSLLVDHSAGAETLVEFPLMIRLDPGRIEYDACLPDGSDVAITDAGGSPLAHEIESWNPGGVSILWVEVPQIRPEARGAELVLRYGTGIPVEPQPDAVWSEHAAVYHLADARDSSPSGFDGTLVGPEAIDGVIGPALSFDGAGAFIDLGTDRPYLQAQTAATVSAWVRLAPDWANPGAAFATSIDNAGMETNASRLQLLVRDDRTFEGGARSEDGGSIIGVIGPAVDVETWTYLAFTVDYPGDRIELFIDGAPVIAGAALGLGPASADSVSTQTTLGRGEQQGVDQVDGDIDEVRLSHVIRSDGEIAANFRSMTDQMVTYGDPTPLP